MRVCVRLCVCLLALLCLSSSFLWALRRLMFLVFVVWCKVRLWLCLCCGVFIIPLHINLLLNMAWVVVDCCWCLFVKMRVCVSVFLYVLSYFISLCLLAHSQGVVDICCRVFDACLGMLVWLWIGSSSSSSSICWLVIWCCSCVVVVKRMFVYVRIAAYWFFSVIFISLLTHYSIVVVGFHVRLFRIVYGCNVVCWLFIFISIDSLMISYVVVAFVALLLHACCVCLYCCVLIISLHLHRMCWGFVRLSLLVCVVSCWMHACVWLCCAWVILLHLRHVIELVLCCLCCGLLLICVFVSICIVGYRICFFVFMCLLKVVRVYLLVLLSFVECVFVYVCIVGYRFSSSSSTCWVF